MASVQEYKTMPVIKHSLINIDFTHFVHRQTDRQTDKNRIITNNNRITDRTGYFLCHSQFLSLSVLGKGSLYY
jgi:hypothetical protein